MHPDVLILDEATAMLDPVSRDEFLEIVERQRKEKSLTIITITHDMTEAIRCEKIYVINKGRSQYPEALRKYSHLAESEAAVSSSLKITLFAIR